MEDVESKFGIDDIAIENHCFLNMYLLPKMHETPFKARFFVASPTSFITSAFQVFYN